MGFSYIKSSFINIANLTSINTYRLYSTVEANMWKHGIHFFNEVIEYDTKCMPKLAVLLFLLNHGSTTGAHFLHPTALMHLKK